MSCAGPCPADKPFECNCFNPTPNLPGADLLARFYKLEEKGQLNGNTANGILTNIISYGFVKAMTECKQAFVAQQNISINCDNDEIGKMVQNSPNCLECRKMAEDIITDRMKLENEAKQKNANYVVQTVSPDIEKEYLGSIQNDDFSNKIDGICKYVCLQCIALNLNQTLNMKIVEACSVSTPDFINAWTQGMSAQAKEEMAKQQKGLESTGVNLQENIDDFSLHISDTIKSMTTINILNSLKQSANIIQETKINSGSTSVVIQNVEQTISVNMFSSLISKVYSNFNVQNSIGYSEKSKQIDTDIALQQFVDSAKNTANTIKDLLTTTIGRLGIILIGLLLGILLIFAGIFFFKPSGFLSADEDDDVEKNMNYEL